MREWSGNYPLRLLVGCMKVSRTAYYAWLVRVAGPGRNEVAVKEKVVELFHYHRGRYGSKRLSAELRAGGVRAGRFVVRRFMREEGLRAKGPRVFRPRTTDSRHSKHASPNLLKELENTAFEAGHAIVGDITYLPLTNGRFCYMAMFQDKRTKRVVGWSVGSRMTAELATEALRMALRRGLVERNAIIHTDRGSQYASGEFRRLIGRCSLRQSMSYGFTEMFNNAIDHSSGSEIRVRIRKNALSTEMLLMDNGVGIFKKIQATMNLLDERHAILELSKGKLTTDPSNHSGEGIFFTSRMFDSFDILSGNIFFTHQFGEDADWILENKDLSSGTSVWMKIHNHTSRTTKKIFGQYTSGDDFGFNKTVVPVKMAQYGEDKLISRSQAKRVLARIELFKTVIFNFEDVEIIGQAFADEIFRVFALRHPEIELLAIKTSDDVKKMISRIKQGNVPSI